MSMVATQLMWSAPSSPLPQAGDGSGVRVLEIFPLASNTLSPDRLRPPRFACDRGEPLISLSTINNPLKRNI